MLDHPPQKQTHVQVPINCSIRDLGSTEYNTDAVQPEYYLEIGTPSLGRRIIIEDGKRIFIGVPLQSPDVYVELALTAGL
jgi:hypothetical protein